MKELRPSTSAQELELMDRIAAAMADDAASADVRGTLADVTLARDAAAAAAERAREVALDPATRDVSAAREVLSDAVFEHDRLAAAAKRLAEQAITADAREAAAKRRAELARVTSERDRLVEELADMRASIVALARLVARVDALDREIKSLGFTQVRHVLASASPEIAALLGESFLLLAASPRPVNKVNPSCCALHGARPIVLRYDNLGTRGSVVFRVIEIIGTPCRHCGAPAKCTV